MFTLFILLVANLYKMNTDQIILDICNDVLKVPITIYEIGRTHPIGKVRGGKIQVIARFSTYRQRNLVERKQNHVDFTFRLLQCLVEPTDLQQVQATRCRRRTDFLDIYQA
jgi:hypothetical protein